MGLRANSLLQKIDVYTDVKLLFATGAKSAGLGNTAIYSGPRSSSTMMMNKINLSLEIYPFTVGLRETVEEAAQIGTKRGGNQRLSNLTLKQIQNKMGRTFEGIVAGKRIEQAYYLDALDREPSLRSDLYIPSDKVSIEMCMSAISHEREKSVLKGLADKESRTLRVMARRLMGRGLDYSKDTARSSSCQLWKTLASVCKLDVDTLDLVA